MTDLQRWKDAVRAAYPQAILRTVNFDVKTFKALYQVRVGRYKQAASVGTMERTPGAAWKSAAERIGK